LGNQGLDYGIDLVLGLFFHGLCSNWLNYWFWYKL
jgi:hypothetical protein